MVILQQALKTRAYEADSERHWKKTAKNGLNRLTGLLSQVSYILHFTSKLLKVEVEGSSQLARFYIRTVSYRQK